MRRVFIYIFAVAFFLSWTLPLGHALAIPEDDATQSLLDAVPGPKVGEDEPPSYPQVSDPLSLRLNIPAARLDLYRQGQWIKSFPVAVGMARYPTPLREYTVSMIIWNPWWVPPESEWAQDAEKTPPGPGNPLGVVKMIMEDGVRIHGTNQASSIGRAISHACIRMYNKDAKELAWEIQSRYSEKTDPALLDTYQRHRGTSYYVSLFEPVPVLVEYRQVERKEDQLWLHPNFYSMEGFAQQLAEALEDHPEVALSEALIKKLNKMRARKSVELSIAQVLEWAKDPKGKAAKPQSSDLPLNPHSAQALTSTRTD